VPGPREALLQEVEKRMGHGLQPTIELGGVSFAESAGELQQKLP
jgi:hypothetical protein